MERFLVLFVCLCSNLVGAQFGSFENQPREERGYSPYYGFSQNFVPRQNRHRNRVSGILHLRPEHQNSNPAYIYSFDNRRGITNTGNYDQYGRPQQNQNPDYETQNYNTQGQNYPDYGRPNYQQYQNYPNYWDYNNGKPVRFPTNNQVPNNNDPIVIVVPEVPSDEPKPEENVIVDQNKNSEYSVDDKAVNFPLKEGEKIYDGESPDVISNTEVITVPPLTSVPPSEVHTESLPFPPLPNDPLPAFTSPPFNAELPANLPPPETVATFDPNNGVLSSKPSLPQESSERGLPPLQPVQPPNSDNGFSVFKPEPTQPDLPPLQQVEPPNPNNSFSFNKPQTPESDLLQPVKPSNPDNGFSFTKPETSQPIFPPLQPVKTSNSDNGFTTFKPISAEQGFPPLQPVNPGAETTLPPLTPVPESGLRNNFNFGPAVNPFKPTCETVDGNVGSCVSLYDCQPYLVRLQQSRSDPGIIQTLRRAHCGFDGNNPKVCCPRPGLPTGLPEIPTAPPATTTTETATTTTTTTTTTPKTTTAKPNATCLPQTYSVAPEDKLPTLPEPPVCGYSNASFSRVVGGVDAGLGDFPFMALLGYKNPRNSTSWLCGGSLITSKHVLTAAHCIKCLEHRLYVVRLGELDLSREDEGATPVDILIKTHVIHKDFSTNTITNDIGLLVLQKEVQFTRLIKPVCLPRASALRSRTYEGYTPMIAGWGDLHFRGPQSQVLQVLQLPVVGNEDCKQNYIKYKSQVIDERVLCAGYKKGGRDACQGDSGGPLMQPIHRTDLLKSNRNAFYFYQIGVVSYGYKCAEPNFPGVYTRVTYFIPWLEEQLLSRR